MRPSDGEERSLPTGDAVLPGTSAHTIQVTLDKLHKLAVLSGWRVPTHHLFFYFLWLGSAPGSVRLGLSCWKCWTFALGRGCALCGPLPIRSKCATCVVTAYGTVCILESVRLRINAFFGACVKASRHPYIHAGVWAFKCPHVSLFMRDSCLLRVLGSGLTARLQSSVSRRADPDCQRILAAEDEITRGAKRSCSRSA